MTTLASPVRPPRRRRWSFRCRPSPWTCRARGADHRADCVPESACRARQRPVAHQAGCVATPTSVPTESKSARKKNTKMTDHRRLQRAGHVELQERRRERGRRAHRALIRHEPGRSPTRVDARIPRERAVNPSCHQNRHRQQAEDGSSAGGDFTAEGHERAGAATISPLHSRPMSAMSGRCRPPSHVSATPNRRDRAAQAEPRRQNEDEPCTATAPSATRHGTRIAATTVKAKKKLWPIAGATAIG